MGRSSIRYEGFARYKIGSRSDYLVTGGLDSQGKGLEPWQTREGVGDDSKATWI